MGPHLPPLDATQVEMLLASLDPQLAGFAGGDGWLADARAYLSRLAGEDSAQAQSTPMEVWLDAWGAAEGNRETLRLALQALQQQLASA